MNEFNRKHIKTIVTSKIILALELEPETCDLKHFSPEHIKAWITGIEQIIEDLQEAVIEVKDVYNVS